jgi:hypothetical protein
MPEDTRTLGKEIIIRLNRKRFFFAPASGRWFTANAIIVALILILLVRKTGSVVWME